MDDYFHLNLKKFAVDTAVADKAEHTGRPPAKSPKPREDATEKTPALSLEDPVVVEDNSDPYNSTGRLKSSVWDG